MEKIAIFTHFLNKFYHCGFNKVGAAMKIGNIEATVMLCQISQRKLGVPMVGFFFAQSPHNEREMGKKKGKK